MSGTGTGSLPTLDRRLLPANTTLLQPATPYFRVSDLMAQITVLQSQIDALHARLAAAGIP